MSLSCTRIAKIEGNVVYPSRFHRNSRPPLILNAPIAEIRAVVGDALVFEDPFSRYPDAEAPDAPHLR